MRAIAREQHVPMTKLLHASTLECVNRGPFQFVLGIFAQHRIHTCTDVFNAKLFGAVNVPPKLEINTPDIVGLFVQQGRGAAVFERGGKPEPAFGRKISLHFDIGNEEVILKDAPLKAEPQHVACGRTRPITGNHPIRLKLVGAIGRIDVNQHMIAVLRHTSDPIAPADFDGRALRLCHANFLYEVFFEIGLL